MQRALGHVLGIHVGRADEERVRVGDRLGAHADAQDVADHAADACSGAAVGIDGGGMVVRLDLEGQIPTAVDIGLELDDAGVVVEDADAPVLVQFVRRRRDRGLQQVVDDLAVHLDQAAERLVLAVLAPGLGDGLELARGGLATLLGVVRLDGLHLDQVEAQHAVGRDPLQLRVVGLEQRDLDHATLLGGRGHAPQEAFVGHVDLLDDLVRERTAGEVQSLGLADGSLELPGRERLHVQGSIECHVLAAPKCTDERRGDRIHDAGTSRDQDVGGSRAFGWLPGLVDPRFVQHRVGQKIGDDGLDAVAPQLDRQQVTAAQAHARDRRDAQFADRSQGVRALGIVDLGATEDLDAPGVRSGGQGRIGRGRGSGGRHGINRALERGGESGAQGTGGEFRGPRWGSTSPRGSEGQHVLREAEHSREGVVRNHGPAAGSGPFGA